MGIDSIPLSRSDNANILVSPIIALVSQVIITANPKRVGLYLYNNSANTVYIAFGPTANSATLMTFPIATFATWVCPEPIYRGVISGIRNSGTGTVIVTELT